MNIKPILCTLFAAFTLVFASCSDSLNPIGGSIQPGGDDINLSVDTFQITAKTVLWESIYARTVNALVGEYKDPIFGRVKSDYLCEFYCPKTTWFSDKLISVDSVYLFLNIHGFVGDSISPMGLSVYMVNQNLDRDFNTNINPDDYCDMTDVMGRSVFTLSGLNSSGAVGGKPLKTISIPLDTMCGRKLYDQWKTNPSTFTNSDSLRKFMPGVYVTTTLGEGTLLNVYATRFAMKYTYLGRNTGNTADSIRTDRSYALETSPIVIQMNRVENSELGNLVSGAADKAYMKSPAGLYTELTIPLSQIADIVRKDTTVNSANFKLTGFTDEEQFSGFERPSQLLFINKDSVDTFFKKKSIPDNKTSFVIDYAATTNSYNFGNISKLVNYYLEKFREENYATIPDLTYVLMPVDLQTIVSTDYYGYPTTQIIGVSNTMLPTSVILRTSPEYMKMPIVYSKYNDRY